MAKWYKQYNPVPLIKELEKSRSINNEGNVQFSGFGIMTALPKLEAMICLNQEITLEDKHGIVQQSIFNVGRRGELLSENILTEINRLEKDYLSFREQNYILATSLSIDNCYHKLSSLQIDNNRITFSASLPKSFAKSISSQQDIKFFAGGKEIPPKYLYVRIAVRAKSIYRATEKALNSLNVFRGLLNYAVNYGQQSFSFGETSRKPINKILLGPIHTLHKPNGKIDIDVFWFEEGYRAPVQPYYDNSLRRYGDKTVKRFDEILKFAHGIRKNIKKSKISKKLLDALLLYNDALDNYDYEVSYIKLWAVLELLTATGQEDGYKVTVRRAAFIFSNPEVEKVHLELLRDFRNELVHRGHRNAKLEIFVYDLKLYVERLLHFLIFNYSKFSSFDDVGYLLDRTTNLEELSRKVKLVNFAKKLNRHRK